MTCTAEALALHESQVADAVATASAWARLPRARSNMAVRSVSELPGVTGLADATRSKSWPLRNVSTLAVPVAPRTRDATIVIVWSRRLMVMRLLRLSGTDQ